MSELDHSAIKRRFSRVPTNYGAMAFLFERVAKAMVDRLDPLTLNPGKILDLGAGQGHLTRALGTAFPRAAITVQDQLAGATAQAAKTRWWRRPHQQVVCDLERIDAASSAFDLVASSMALQWLNDPDPTLREAHRLLRPDGVCLLSVPGPRSFAEIRAAWAAVDETPKVAIGIDLHDLGDALARAGFASVVADSDLLTLEYHSLERLQADLTASASGNPFAARRPGLSGRAYWQRFAEALGPAPFKVTLELVYAHAFKPTFGDDRATNGEVNVDISTIRRRR